MNKPGTNRGRAWSTGLFVAMLLAGPSALAAQECKLVGSAGANTAAEVLRGITEESTPDELNLIYTSAMSSLEPELDGKDRHAIAYLLASQAEIGLGDFANAKEYIDTFDGMLPECAEHSGNMRFRAWVELFNRGIDAYSSGDNEGALADFALANDFTPDLRSYNNAGLIYTEMGDNAKAAETYQSALDHATPDADPAQLQTAIRGLGDALTADHRAEEALAAYESYLQQYPDDVVIQIKFALSAAEAGREEEAATVFSEVLSRDDLEPQQWIEVGVGLYNSEDYEQAATAFGKARAANPYHKEAMENYVNASVQANRPGTVLALADTLVAWYPYDAANYQLLASALAKADMEDKAMEVIADQEATQVVFNFVQMAPNSGTSYVVKGSFETKGASGALSIPFEFLDAGGQVIATEVLTTEAPAEGESQRFQLSVDAGVPLAGFRYRKAGT